MKRTIIVNFSGGIDSEAALIDTLKKYPKDEILICWQDTGAEYIETEPFIDKIASILELPVLKLRNESDFWQQIEGYGKLPHTSNRNCSRKLKAHVLEHYIRTHRTELGQELIVISGIRSDESEQRSRLSCAVDIDPRITLKDGTFTARKILPVFRLKKEQCFEMARAEGLPIHPCYTKEGGWATRLSCWCCIFAHPNEVRPYAEMHPDLYKKACEAESKVKDKWWLNLRMEDLFSQKKLF